MLHVQTVVYKYFLYIFLYLRLLTPAIVIMAIIYTAVCDFEHSD